MNVISWAESNWRLENGELVQLRPWQRKFLSAAFPLDGSLSRFETFLISGPKKIAKTETNAIATGYAALTLPAPETVFVVANDLEQATERVFERLVRAFRAMGLEARGEVVVTKSEVFFLETGTRIVAVPADFAGAAGALFGVTSWTELWAYRHESHTRLWEELTPIPTRPGLRLVDSYAGFTGDAPVLEPLWGRALAGEQVDDDPPVYVNGRLWAMVDQGEAAQRRGWLGDPADMAAYYKEQAASLRPGTFARLHLNQWQSGEEAFITAADYDACVVESLAPVLPGATNLRLSVGVDAGVRRDCSAVVAVARDGDRIRLVQHRIWQPRPGHPVDLEETIERFVLELCAQFTVTRIRLDPTQLERSMATFVKHGLPVERFAQTSENLLSASQSLWDAFRHRQLMLYAAPDLRSHCINAVAVEGVRGWRLAKEKASRHIDGAVALSFATLGAIKDRTGGQVVSYCTRCVPPHRVGDEPTAYRCAWTGGSGEGPAYRVSEWTFRGEKYIDKPSPA